MEVYLGLVAFSESTPRHWGGAQALFRRPACRAIVLLDPTVPFLVKIEENGKLSNKRGTIGWNRDRGSHLARGSQVKI
jgi:hypothetical protein